jgi:hypothetical protein
MIFYHIVLCAKEGKIEPVQNLVNFIVKILRILQEFQW